MVLSKSFLSIFQWQGRRQEDVAWHNLHISLQSQRRQRPPKFSEYAWHEPLQTSTRTCWCIQSSMKSDFRHLTSSHNLQDISQNIGISREKPQLLPVTRKEKKGLKLAYIYLPCSQFKQQKLEHSMKWAALKLLKKNYAGATSRQQTPDFSAGDIKSLTWLLHLYDNFSTSLLINSKCLHCQWTQSSNQIVSLVF